MSLFSKPINDITFEDVDEFCKSQLEESARLDYKDDWPSDLAKTMAAMANTIGGVIILGVDAHETTNKPIWPPLPPQSPRVGLPFFAGLSERATQIAHNAIFPPLSVEVSPPIRNSLLQSQGILVVRVPESKDAPHAIDGKRGIYIYERVGNTSDPHKRAEVDYIERLILRRQGLEKNREILIEEAIERSMLQINSPKLRHRWASVIPFYPWRKVNTPENSHEFHKSCTQNEIAHNADSRHQRMPGGSFCLLFDVYEDGSHQPIACSSVFDNGHIFAMSLPIEYVDQMHGDTVDLGHTSTLLETVIKAAQ